MENYDEIKKTIKSFISQEGKIKTMPVKYKMRMHCWVYILQFISPEKEYTEKELNALINEHTDFIDPATIRRELVDTGFIERKGDCTAYWLANPQPLLADIFR